MAVCDLHHLVEGPPGAPALLLGPALGTSTEVFDRNTGALAERFRVVRYDHRGQGASPVPAGPYEIADLGGDVVALLDRLEIERASVGGVSLGGMVALWLGADAPERVDRIVAACTSAHLPGAGWPERAAAVRAAGTTEAISDTVVDRWLTRSYARERPDVRDRLRRLLVSSPPQGYAECCDAIGRMDLRPALARISAPTLVISGADDPAAPPSEQRAIADSIPGARLEVIDNAAHLANVEQPVAFNRLVLEHLGRA